MKRPLAIALILAPLLAFAQDRSQDDPLAALMKPGEAQAALKPWIGEWEVTMKVWKTPEAPPEILRGQATRRWLHDRRFVHETMAFKEGARPFTTEAFYGHNNWSKRYQLVFLSSRDTAIYTYQGAFKKDGALELTGQWSIDQGGRAFDVKTRIATRHPDAETEIIEIAYEYPGGRSHKAVEYRYRRRAQK